MFTVARRRLAPDASGGTLTSSADTTSTPSTLLVPLQCWTHTDSGNGETCIVTAYAVQSLRVTLPDSSINGAAAEGPHGGMVWELLWFCDRSSTDIDGRTTPSGSKRRDKQNNRICRKQFVYQNVDPSDLWPWCASAAAARSATTSMSSSGTETTVQGGVLFFSTRCIAIATERGSTVPRLDTFHLMESPHQGDGKHNWLRQEGAITLGTDTAPAAASRLLYIDSAQTTTHAATVPVVYVTEHSLAAPQRQSSSGRAPRRWLQVCSAEVCAPAAGAPPVTVSPSGECLTIPIEGGEGTEQFVRAWQWMLIHSSSTASHRGSLLAVLPRNGGATSSMTDGSATGKGMSQQRFACIRCADEGSIGISLPRPVAGGGEEDEEDDLSALDPEEVLQRLTTDWTTVCIVPATPTGRRVTDFGQLMKEGPMILHVVTPGDVVHASPSPLTRIKTPGLYESQLSWADVRRGGTASALARRLRVPRGLTAWWGTQPVALAASPSSFTAIPTNSAYAATQPLPPLSAMLYNKATQEWELATVWCQDGHGELAQYTSLSTTIHTKLGLALDDGKQGRDVSAVGEALVESLISERFTPHLAHHKQQLHAGSSKSATSGVAQDLVAGLSSRLLDGAATDAPLREMYAAMVHHAAVLRGEEQAVEGHSFIHYASRVRDNAEHALSFSPTNKQWHTLSQIVSALCLELLRQMSWRATSDTAAAVERAVIALLLGARGPVLHAAVQPQSSQPSLEDAHLIHGLQVVLALVEEDTWTTLEGKYLSAMWVRRMLLLYACRKATVPLEMLTDDIISEAVVVDGNSISESLIGMVCALWQAVDESTLLEMVDTICNGDGSDAGGCLSPAEVHQLLDGARGALAPMLGDALPPSLVGLVPLAAAVAAATTGAGFMHSGADACLGAVDAVLATFNTASLALPLALRRGPQCAALTRYPWCSMPPLVFFYFWLRVADAVDTEEQQTGHASYLKESAHILWFIIQGHAEIAADVMAALTRIANEEGGTHHSASSSPPGLTLDAFASVMHASELQEGAARLNDAQTDTWAERCVARVLHLCFASASGKALRSLVLAAAMASVPLSNTGKGHDDGDAPPNAIQLATMFKAASEASGDTLTRTLLLLQSSKEKEEGHSVSIRSGAVVSRALRAVSLRIWNFVHQKDSEAVTNAVLCDKLYEAFATLRENAVFKMHSSSAADSTASTTLLSFLRVYFIHDYPLLLSGVSAVYCRSYSSPQQEQRRCVQYDSILSPSQQQQQQQRRSVEELLMVGEVCERVRHTLLRLLSLYGDRSLCARLLGELFKLVATAADLADGDASDQQQHVTAVQKRGGVFFLSPPAAYFISSQVQSAETGRFVVSTAVIHRELLVFVHQQMQLPAVPEVDDESYMRHQVSTFINDVADACEGVSACLGSCMPIYEPALSLIILSVVGETVPPCYQAVTQGVIGSAAAKIMRPLRPEEKQQCLLAVRPSFAARIPHLAPHGHQHKQQTAKRYEDSEVHRRVSHRVLPSVLATARAMKASSSCDDPSGNLSRRRASADTPLPAVITITNSLLSVLGVPSPTSTIAPHAMPYSHTNNNSNHNNSSASVNNKTLSKGDAAVSILVREEKFRRDQLAGELLAGYTAWLHSTPFQEALGTLYVAMRMERRRRELLKHALEQVDIINTFEARYFSLAKEMLLEEERRVRDESDRRRVDERRALAESEEEDRLGVEAQCSTERSALWALAAQQEDVLLTEDSSRWAWRDVEVSDRQALIKACLMERQRLGMHDTLLAEEEILSIPREPHAPQQAPPPSSSNLRTTAGEDDNMGGIVGGFSLVMGASEGLLRGFNQFQSKLRDTVAPPPLQRAQPDHSTGADAVMGNYVASGINKGKAPSNEKVVADEGWDWLCDEKEEVHGDKNNSNPPTRNAAADDGWGWSDDDDARTTMPVRGTTSAAQIGPPTGATTQLSRQVRHVPPEEEEEEDTSTMCKKPRPHHKKRKGLQAEVIVAPVASSTPVPAEEVIDASTQATQTVPTARNIYDALHDAAEGDHDDDNNNRQNVRKALDDSVDDGWGWEDEDGDDFSGISGARPREDVAAAAAAAAAAAHSALLSLEGTERALLTVEEVVGREGLKRHRIFQYL